MDNSNTTHIKREVLVRLIKAFVNQEMNTLDKIPFEMRPKNAEVPYRCCIYKERAILRQRTMVMVSMIAPATLTNVSAAVRVLELVLLLPYMKKVRLSIF